MTVDGEQPPMGRPRDPILSALFATFAGATLWPLGAVYWSPLGGALSLAVVATLAFALGAAFARVTGVRPGAFAAGGVAAYAVGMVAVEATIGPDSPVHLLLYAGLLVCLLVGVVAVARLSSVR